MRRTVVVRIGAGGETGGSWSVLAIDTDAPGNAGASSTAAVAGASAETETVLIAGSTTGAATSGQQSGISVAIASPAGAECAISGMHSAAHADTSDGMPLSVTAISAVSTWRIRFPSYQKERAGMIPALRENRQKTDYGHVAETILTAVIFM
jgi:hypothetical protein